MPSTFRFLVHASHKPLSIRTCGPLSSCLPHRAAASAVRTYPTPQAFALSLVQAKKLSSLQIETYSHRAVPSPSPSLRLRQPSPFDEPGVDLLSNKNRDEKEVLWGRWCRNLDTPTSADRTKVRIQSSTHALYLPYPSSPFPFSSPSSPFEDTLLNLSFDTSWFAFTLLKGQPSALLSNSSFSVLTRQHIAPCRSSPPTQRATTATTTQRHNLRLHFILIDAHKNTSITGSGLVEKSHSQPNRPRCTPF